MKSIQLTRKEGGKWSRSENTKGLKNPLVFIFGSRYSLEKETIYDEMRELFPTGHLIFGSTSGDITSKEVFDDGITVTAVEFEKSSFLVRTQNISEASTDSYKTGVELVNQLPLKNLKFIFVVSEGSFVNGSELTKGMNDATEGSILITGGLCGDDARFEKTLASYNENPKSGEIVAIGFYGDSFEASFSTYGGWTPFGPERIVTKSESNVLYEVDDIPALSLYKKYLGNKSKELPSAALLYPLNVTSNNEEHSFVRTILNIDEEKNTMILAGDIPVGSKVQLMMTSMDNIANGSEQAAQQALKTRGSKPQLALLISCIGRRLVLDQRVEEEVEEVVEVIGRKTTVAGFYSYGEIAPFNGERNCQLHNQTITVTLLSE